MKRLLRHRAFLLSILREGNRNKRHDLIQHANGEQINAVSELVLNMLKNCVPVSPPLMAKLRRHKKVLKELSRRKNSIKIEMTSFDESERLWLLARSTRSVL